MIDAPDAQPGPAAGLLRRAMALVVDLGVVWLLLWLGRLGQTALARYDLVAQAFGLAYVLVLPAAYFVLGHGTRGQTLGKRLLGARVVDTRGTELGYLRALGRLLAWCLSAALLGAGFVVAAVRSDRRGLHDLLAGTRVVRAR